MNVSEFRWLYDTALSDHSTTSSSSYLHEEDRALTESGVSLRKDMVNLVTLDHASLGEDSVLTFVGEFLKGVTELSNQKSPYYEGFLGVVSHTP